MDTQCQVRPMGSAGMTCTLASQTRLRRAERTKNHAALWCRVSCAAACVLEWGRRAPAASGQTPETLLDLAIDCLPSVQLWTCSFVSYHALFLVRSLTLCVMVLKHRSGGFVSLGELHHPLPSGSDPSAPLPRAVFYGTAGKQGTQGLGTAKTSICSSPSWWP